MNKVIDIIPDIVAKVKKNVRCLTASGERLEHHQTGFDGEHIGQHTLKKKGIKGVKTTKHKDPLDIITKRSAYEVKTFKKTAKHKQMGVTAGQRKKKLAWAKAEKKKAKSMMVIINDKAEVYVKDGIGKFRPGSMKKIATYKDWRKEVGHGRKERFAEVKKGKVLPKETKVFRSKTNQSLYEQRLREYDVLTESQIKRRFVREIGKEMDHALYQWAEDTNSLHATALKLKALQLERGTITARIPVRLKESKASISAIDKIVKNIPDEKYVNMRALTQSYYRKRKIRKVKLFRGIGGSTGGSMAIDLEELESRIGSEAFNNTRHTIREGNIVSMTDRLKVANEFGRDRGGVTIARTVDVDDVILNSKLFPQDVEGEYIVKGGKVIIEGIDIDY